MRPKFTDDEIAAKYWSLEEAYMYCEHVTYDHYENFPVASLFIPARLRKHICAIYAFARFADDIADEPGLATEERLVRLDDWKTQLDDCYNDSAPHPVFLALNDTVGRFNLPKSLFEDLLTAFRRDCTVNRYETFDDLLDYCRCSANPVGRLVLLLFEYTDEQLFRWSDSICTALQLTNFWQDCSVDIPRNRLYIPREEMRKYGCSEQDVSNRKDSPEFRSMLKGLVERTKGLFTEGKPLVSAVSRDLRAELRLTWFGGSKILEKIEILDYDVLQKRPLLSRKDKVLLALKAFL